MSPHAHSGGCIFYNRQFLNSLMEQWMKIDDPDAIRPMLYAIFAHELGHLAHADFDPTEENVPVKNKELAADQFAGYSLARLGIRRARSGRSYAVLPVTGDDFVGHNSGHGNGGERTRRFRMDGIAHKSDCQSKARGRPADRRALKLCGKHLVQYLTIPISY